MITLKNTTDKQTFHIPRPVIDTEVVADFETPNVSISGNGFFQVAPSKGKRALSAVNLDVSVEQNNQNKTKTYTENGKYTIEAEEPYTGLGKVDVEVAIDTTPIYEDGYANGTMDQKSKLTTLSVASNGTYNNEDGYDWVNVDVNPALQTKTVNYTENGKFTVKPDDGYDGLSKVTVKVDAELQTKDVEYTDNGDYSVTPDEGYMGLEKVNVKVNYDTSNVPFIVPAGMRFQASTVERYPDNMDWSLVEAEGDLSNMFKSNSKLKEAPTLALSAPILLYQMFWFDENLQNVDVSKWNTANVTSMNGLFYNCGKLETLDLSGWDMSNVTDASDMFASCQELRIKFGTFNTSKNKNFQRMFYNCTKLREIPELDFSSNTASYKSYNSPTSSCTVLRRCGGFKGITSSVWCSSNVCLSYESTLNILNGLADGVSGQTLYLHQSVVNQLSDDDIAIATNKGWSISPTKTITSPVVVTDLSVIPSDMYQLTPGSYDFSQYTGSWKSSENSSALPDLYVFEGDVSSSTDLSAMFGNRANVRYIILNGVQNVSNMSKMFYNCTRLIEVYMDGDVSNVSDVSDMFSLITTEGTFYYNPKYDYSKIIEVLPATWTAVPKE